MMFWHRRWRRQVSLLANHALEDHEREAVLLHIDGCRACRTEYADLVATLGVLAADPVHDPEPPIPLGAFKTRVIARAEEAEPQPRETSFAGVRVGPALRLAFRSLPAAIAVMLALLVLPPPLRPPLATTEPAVDSLPEHMLRRAERRMARERAARYLNEAQDVLLTMAAARQDCDRQADRLDVTAEAQRSRELLARRALAVELDEPGVMSARPVFEDVDQVLRDVAALASCARSRDVALIHERVEQQRLLMKIDLLTQELMG